jgi:hypothetical protein
MPVEYTTANQATDVGGVKALVHGGSGTGKTVLMATLPSPLLISAESGLLSLRKGNLERLFGPGQAQIDYNVKVAKVSTVEDLTQAYNWCRDHAWSNGIRSLGLDSISEIMEKGQDLVRKFRDLPGLNICMVAKQELVKDEATGVARFGPAIPGSKLGPSMPYFFDEVFALRIGKQLDGTEFRYLQTQPDLQYEAKDRSGMLAPMEYPHLGAVFSKVLAA